MKQIISLVENKIKNSKIYKALDQKVSSACKIMNINLKKVILILNVELTLNQGHITF